MFPLDQNITINDAYAVHQDYLLDMPKKLTEVANVSDKVEAKSLIMLAESNTLPRFQYMDNPTFSWILQNNPRYKVSDLPDIQSDLAWLNTVTLPTRWFLEHRIIDSLHGLRHLLRTAYLTLCLAHEISSEKLNPRHAALAALVHDIRRRDDKRDEGHARRSGSWFRSHAAEVGFHFGIDLMPIDVLSIETAIALHEAPYDGFTPKQMKLYNEHRVLVDILKTADALDRYRLPKLRWWINDKYLRLVPSRTMKQVAFDLIALSEGSFLKTGDSHGDTMNAAKHLRLRYDSAYAHWHNTHVFYGTYRRGL